MRSISIALAALALSFGGQVRAESPTCSAAGAAPGLAAALAAAWDQGDANAWAALYTPDAEFLNVSGLLFEGRDAIRARHVSVFAGQFRGSRLSLRIRRVRPLGPDHALLETSAEVRGPAPSAGMAPIKPEVMRTLFTFALTRGSRCDWKIVFSQNTLIPAGTPAS